MWFCMAFCLVRIMIVSSACRAKRARASDVVGGHLEGLLHQHAVDDSDDRKAHGDLVDQEEDHEPLRDLWRRLLFGLESKPRSQ